MIFDRDIKFLIKNLPPVNERQVVDLTGFNLCITNHYR